MFSIKVQCGGVNPRSIALDGFTAASTVGDLRARTATALAAGVTPRLLFMGQELQADAATVPEQLLQGYVVQALLCGGADPSSGNP